MRLSVSTPPCSYSYSYSSSLTLSHIRHIKFPYTSPSPPRRLLSISASVRQLWTPSPLSSIHPAADSLFHLTLDVSHSTNIVSSHTLPGQYVQVRLPNTDKPAFLAIASPPRVAVDKGELEFLVKVVEGSVVEALCGLKKGDLVEVTEAMGKGFQIGLISPPKDFPTVFIFSTGSGISPIRSLIETGFDADKRPDVRLYYGARNLQRMAYQDRFKEWEASGVKIVPVLSQPDDNWSGERGYVQAAFARAEQINSPQGTGVLLCGHKQMAEEVTALLTANGVPNEKILKNF